MEELNQFDMKIVMEMDDLVSQQQATIEKAGVPGYHPTADPKELRLQMYLSEFILSCGRKAHG